MKLGCIKYIKSPKRFNVGRTLLLGGIVAIVAGEYLTVTAFKRGVIWDGDGEMNKWFDY